MQFYRIASWLYVLVGSLVLPLLVLDLCVDWQGLTAVWGTLFGLCVPLMVIQALGLRRVLRERAPQEDVANLVTWYWLLHLVGTLVVLLAAAFFFADKAMWALWTLIIGALPMLGVGVGVGVVKLVLGIRLGKYPDDLFGLLRPLSFAFIAFGALELANMVIFVSLPFYLVVAMALMYLSAFVIEGHAREVAPRFGVAPLWISYVLGAVLTLGVPLAALPVLAESVSAFMAAADSDDYEDSYEDQDEDDEQAETSMEEEAEQYLPRNPNKRGRHD